MPIYSVEPTLPPLCTNCSLEHKYCALRAALDSLEKWYNCSVTINICNWRSNEKAQKKAQQTL